MNASADPRDGAPRFTWRSAAWAGAFGLCLLPLVGMNFSAQVDWSPGDFLVLGATLLAAGGALELLLRASRRASYRLSAAVAVLTGFLLFWANQAVGIVGDRGNPTNLAFFALPAVGLSGAAPARLQPRSRAFALLVVAALQLAPGLTILAHDPLDVGVITAAFTGFWWLAEGLFWLATGSRHHGWGRRRIGSRCTPRSRHCPGRILMRRFDESGGTRPTLRDA